MSNRWWVSALLGVSVAAFSVGAAANPETHDGFYFRGATGLGYFKSSISPGDASFSGLDIGFDAWFGGSPIPGLAIGGGITTFDVPSPSFKVNGQSVPINGHLLLDIVGMFGDYYFDPTKGMHLEGLVGYAALGGQNSNGTSSGSDAGGLALGAGFGNDWWVSDEWSIGVLGRVIYAPLSLSGTKYSTITPAVMATFIYN